ncbi:MAG: DUF4232 domain-containing protein [Chloroflexi bacterium]|nr:DUF4232 domain-containing protein [Chloroflexota bacterium]
MIAPWFVGPSLRARRTLLATLLVALAASACGGDNVSTPSPGASVSAPAGPTASSSPSGVATPAGPTPDLPCDARALVARVIRWEGAAGSRIASVDMANAGSAPCLVFSLARPQLLDGTATILIDGGQPSTSAPLLVQPGAVLTTEVRTSNYCGPNPAAPVTVAFVIQDGLGRVLAAPTTATDTSGVPPCNGAAGSPGSIDMQPWVP